MFGNKYLYLAVLSINLICGVCYVNYNQFPGFYEPSTTMKTFKWQHVRFDGNAEANPLLKNATNEETDLTAPTVISGRREMNFSSPDNYKLTTLGMKRNKPKLNVKQFKVKCPENELPSSIGSYEIPTQRDLVLFTQRTLLKMFNSYHEKTLLLLKDITEATHATMAVEKKCHGIGKRLYKQCVKQVNKKFVTLIKERVQSLEHQEAQAIAMTEGKICNLTSMKTDPIELIQILAMDEATLEFALPAFLRLLGRCAVHCNKPAPPDHRPRLRHLTDQELVVKHFLTNKSYLQLLKDNHV